MSHYKERHSKFLWVDSSATHLSVIFTYKNYVNDSKNKSIIYVRIDIDSLRFQNIYTKQFKWDSTQVQKETISNITTLIIPRNEFLPLDSLLPELFTQQLTTSLIILYKYIAFPKYYPAFCSRVCSDL